jgi:hypothetical protein
MTVSAADRNGRAPAGKLIVSFDVELGWGSSGELTPRERERVKSARALLPELLETVRSTGSVATWAVTMAVLHEGPTAFNQFLNEQGESAFGSQICQAYPHLAGAPEAYFYPELLSDLLHCPGQEVACHGYSHVVWDGLSGAEQWLDRELRLSQELAKRLGVQLLTLVFPKNRYSALSLAVARRHGFLGFRGDEFVSESRELSLPALLLGRTRRFLGAFGLGGSASRGTVRSEAGLLRVPGQRFLRLEDPSWLRRAHLAHVRAELSALARRGEILHIWCHPENFTREPRVALSAFRGLLALGAELREAGLIENITMAEACSQRTWPL